MDEISMMTAQCEILRAEIALEYAAMDGIDWEAIDILHDALDFAEMQLHGMLRETEQ